MATMACHYYSYSLQRRVDIEIIIPTPEGNEQISDENIISKFNYQKGLPVIYLLHGAYGNYSSWTRFSNIERYVQKYKCCVVMASADNSFYQDMYHGGAYYTFFSKELPSFVKNIFPVSDKREDTYIAGLSMGGYGAWFLALSNPHIYSKAASLSGALDIVKLYDDFVAGKVSGPFDWNSIFENPEKLSGSFADLFFLYENCKSKGEIPDLYQAWGNKDFLYEDNVSVKNRLQSLNANLYYEESEGGHDWDFWDCHIKKVLSWIFDEKN